VFVCHSPVYNPSGKYMVKLHFNGVPRKVIVDDRLPVDRSGRLLCSYSTNPNELWVSIIEKAYLKVHGGYDFPGSNSGIDLFALTGWIPESMRTRGDDFNVDRTWERLRSGSEFGDCLITIATGPLTEAEEEMYGLVSTHAYALLDVKEVLGHKLVQLKNPWSHKRWRGKFSQTDDLNWTPELRAALRVLCPVVWRVNQCLHGCIWYRRSLTRSRRCKWTTGFSGLTTSPCCGISTASISIGTQSCSGSVVWCMVRGHSPPRARRMTVSP
jgi:hypothetical protein